MAIYISNSLYISGGLGADINANNPIIGYHSILRNAEIIAVDSVAGRPAINMWNPDTSSVWQGETDTTTTTQYIELINTDNAAVDYVGIAKHNLGSVGYTYSIEHSTDDGGTWNAVTSPRSIATNNAILDYFDALTSDRLRIKLTKTMTGTIPAPVIAHIKMGVALVLQRRIFSGHEPSTIARKTRRISNGSESGQYLGTIVTRSYFLGSINQTNNTADFVREYIKPFIEHVAGSVLGDETAPNTFFFAWRPSDYPDEIVYGWTEDNISPKNTQGSAAGGLMEWSCSMECVA